jgi:hypothetical protein
MADDFDFRSLFGPIETDAAKIDTRSVIRRARRRRLPAQVALGGGAVVAAGVLFAGAAVGVKAFSSASTAGSASSVAAAPQSPSQGESTQDFGDTAVGSGALDSTDQGLKRAPAEKLNLCGGALADVAPSATGLVLTPHFRSASAKATSVSGTVTVTNTSTTRWSGSTASSPSITLSQHGVVLWHTFAMDASARVLDLAPGESADYPATLAPVVCGVEDDLDGERADLPHVKAGEYQVSAALDVPADELSDLVTGSQQTITLK